MGAVQYLAQGSFIWCGYCDIVYIYNEAGGWECLGQSSSWQLFCTLVCTVCTSQTKLEARSRDNKTKKIL